MISLTFKLASVAFVLWIVMNGLILVAANHKNMAFFANPIPEHLRPGSNVPSYPTCDYHIGYGESVAYCYEDEVYYVFNRYDHVVIHASTMLPEREIGEYIAAWGDPDRVDNRYLMHQLYWGKVQVWTMGTPFTPHLRAYMIVMDAKDHGTDVWQGFKSAH